jgi:hypothetical protein
MSMSKTAAKLLVGAAAVCVALALGSNARAGNTRVCVDISLKQGMKEGPSAPDAKAKAWPLGPAPAADSPVPAPPGTSGAPEGEGAQSKDGAKRPEGEATRAITPGSEGDVLPKQASDKPGNLPLGHRPLAYMKRLIEHFVSHEHGFEAVQTGCHYTIFVELYPLEDGWTAFARYSGTGREERVDRLLPSELSQFAERVATSLLYGKPISATINRENVLVSDSKAYTQRIRGSGHFMMGVGTQLRLGRFATAVPDADDPRSGEAVDKYRFFSPVSVFLGYRGRFESWGLETAVMGSIGTAKTSILTNPGGGHIDYTANTSVQLHFMRYFDPRGLTSFYMGAGATFEFLIFQAIIPASKRNDSTRSYLLGGGVDVDLILGWEFMRASTAQFFLQAEAQLPAYLLANQNDEGGLHSWFPAMTMKLGVMF